MFKRTTAINKIAKLRARKKVIQGSTSAGKTYAIVPLLIDIAIKKTNYDGYYNRVVMDTPIQGGILTRFYTGAKPC